MNFGNLGDVLHSARRYVLGQYSPRGSALENSQEENEIEWRSLPSNKRSRESK